MRMLILNGSPRTKVLTLFAWMHGNGYAAEALPVCEGLLHQLSWLLPVSAFRLGFTNGLMSESMILWFGIMLISTDTAYRVCYPALKKNFFNWRRNRSAIGVKV